MKLVVPYLLLEIVFATQGSITPFLPQTIYGIRVLHFIYITEYSLLVFISMSQVSCSYLEIITT